VRIEDADSVVDRIRATGATVDEVAEYDRVRRLRHQHKGDAELLTERERGAFEEVRRAAEVAERAEDIRA